MGEAADVVREAFERFNAGDDEGFLALCSKRIVWRDVPEIPDSQTYHGPDGVRQWMENVREPTEGLRFVRWDVEEQGDSVAVDTSAEGQGRSSGVAVGWRFWTVWRVKNGLITYHHGWSDRDDALADLRGER